MEYSIVYMNFFSLFKGGATLFISDFQDCTVCYILHDVVFPRHVYYKGFLKSTHLQMMVFHGFWDACCIQLPPHILLRHSSFTPQACQDRICVISWTASILRSPVSWASHVAQQQSWVQEFRGEGRRDKNNSCKQSEGGDKYA